jgi:hypothetical protein
MKESRDRLIETLCNELGITHRVGKTWDMILFWLVLNFLIAFVLVYLGGPFRDGSLRQAGENIQFLLESIIGLVAIIALGITAIRSGIPAGGSFSRRYAPALLVLLVWIGFYFVGIWHPALEPSMVGKRDNLCYLETLIYGLPSLLVGLYLLSRLWPTNGGWSGLMVGLVAGMTPALLMQFACMYIPLHIIMHHLLPGLVLAITGLLLGKIYLYKS